MKLHPAISLAICLSSIVGCIFLGSYLNQCPECFRAWVSDAIMGSVLFAGFIFACGAVIFGVNWMFHDER